ncbi:MAG TPA: O-methyltransferase [bacterium]|jgi:caffeoyl-CoA O-methyltransferase|nr:O-methyltransferase [bacterium]
MAIFQEPVKKYLYELGQITHPILKEMQAYGESRRFPIVNCEVGRVLYQLTVLSKAKKVFELGSGFGYSTMWFALALPPSGVVHHTDGDPENTKLAHHYFEKAGLLKKVRFHTGDALQSLAKTPGKFDIYYCDIDKDGYPAAYQAIAKRAQPGNIVITDNLLWSGKVAQPGPDVTTKAILEYTKAFWNDKRFASSMLPIRDGVGFHLRLGAPRKF